MLKNASSKALFVLSYTWIIIFSIIEFNSPKLGFSISVVVYKSDSISLFSSDFIIEFKILFALFITAISFSEDRFILA